MGRCWRSKLWEASLPRKAGGAGRGGRAWSLACSTLSWKLKEKVDVGSLVSSEEGTYKSHMFGPDVGCMTFQVWGITHLENRGVHW